MNLLFFSIGVFVGWLVSTITAPAEWDKGGVPKDKL